MKIPYEALSLDEAIRLLEIMNGYFDADTRMIILEDEPYDI